MNQLLSSCLKVAVDTMVKNPDYFIGFYGQWDQLDVKNMPNESQRFRLWKRIAANKIPNTKYEFVADENFNFLMLVPVHMFSNSVKKEIQTFFENRFKSKLDDFKIPSIQEFEAKRMSAF